VGGMICIAAANAGATSQDLKTGYIVGATPRYQQLALFIGAIVSSIAIGYVIKVLDTPTADMAAQGITHAIGSERYAAPQATLMATLAKGILSFNLDWQFVMVGVFIAVMIELCGIKALAFAIGLYLPLSTTLPIFIGGAIKGIVDWRAERKNEPVADDDLGRGSLFATGLIAGGALAGVVVALLSVNDNIFNAMKTISAEHGLTEMLGAGGYSILAVLFFAAMALMLYRLAIKKTEI
jgi:putative OPT family oligopeptide transporter